MTSKLFLNNITVIDHAYIDAEGRQMGGSFHASFEVGGEVSADEQVVIDFSAVKKHIKAIVDHPDTGFDHKLWFIPAWSGGTATFNGNRVTVSTPAVELVGPRDMIAILPLFSYAIAEIERVIAAHVEKELHLLYPEVGVKVACRLSTAGFLNANPNTPATPPWYFQYSHGLRNSSSYGCQNIAHGHLSWMELEHDKNFRQECSECQSAVQALFSTLQQEWHEAVLIDDANIVAYTPNSVSISYTSARGAFSGTYHLPQSKIKVIATETTVENIVDAFVRENGYFIERAHVSRIYVSEGLAKGAFKDFKYD